jgi:hypothetical protein
MQNAAYFKEYVEQFYPDIDLGNCQATSVLMRTQGGAFIRVHHSTTLAYDQPQKKAAEYTFPVNK